MVHALHRYTLMSLLALLASALAAADLTVFPGSQTVFTATVVDQFGEPMANQTAHTVNWNATGGSLSAATGASTTYTAGGMIGDYVLSAESGSLSTLRSIAITAVLPGLDFTGAGFVSYGGSQDQGGTVTLEDAGRTVALAGNTWKAVAHPYMVTEATILRFEFRSTIAGEIQGIGLDEDLAYEPNLRVFQLHGSDPNNKFIQDFHDYPGDGAWKTYEIPIGQYYTGAMSYLVFVNDHDNGGQDGTSAYRSIQILEGGQVLRTIIMANPEGFLWEEVDGLGTAIQDGEDTRIEGLEASDDATLHLVPDGGTG